MKKTIRILAILAEALAVVSMIALVSVIAMQEQLKTLYTTAPGVVSRFAIPMGPNVYVVCVMAALVLLIVAAWSKNNSIWPELITVLLLTVSPWMQKGAVLLQNMVWGQMYGAEAMAALSVMQTMSEIPLTVAHLAVTLALITCGMSIGRKKSK